MTPYTDPCCHGADVEASTRPRSATPLINHLRHRVVTALCEERSTWRHLQSELWRGSSGHPVAPALSGPGRPAAGKFSRKLSGLKGRVGMREETFEKLKSLHRMPGRGGREPGTAVGGGHGAGAGQGTDFLSRPRVCRVYGMLRDLPGKQTHQEALECYLLPPSTSLLALSLKVKVAQSCPTLCDPVDYTVHGILQARTLEWVAFPFSRDRTQALCLDPVLSPSDT